MATPDTGLSEQAILNRVFNQSDNSLRVTLPVRVSQRKAFTSRLRTSEDNRLQFNTVSAGSTVISYHLTLKAIEDCYKPQFTWGNWRQTGGGLADVVVAGTGFILKAGLETSIGGAIIPITFNGGTATSFTFSGSTMQNITCDPIDYEFAAGTIFRIRQSVTAVTDTNDYFPGVNIMNSGFGSIVDQRQIGADGAWAVTGGEASNNGNYCYAPNSGTALIRNQTKPVVLSVGDSITMGSGDTGNFKDMGYVIRAFSSDTYSLNLSNPVINIGHSGATLNDYGTIATVQYRWKPVDIADYAIVELGVNDKSTTSAAIKTRALTLWFRLYRYGLKVFQNTITPYVPDSYDSWATVNGQIPHGYRLGFKIATRGASGGVATFTTTGNHLMTGGETVSISRMSDAGYNVTNGTVLPGASGNTFTMNTAHGNETLGTTETSGMLSTPTAIANDGGGKIKFYIALTSTTPSFPGSGTVTVSGVTGLTTATVKSSGGPGVGTLTTQTAYAGPYPVFEGQIESTTNWNTLKDFNNWVRDGAPIDSTLLTPVAIGAAGLRAGDTGHPLKGWFEIADTAESARDSGKFTVSFGTPTTDGIHPSSVMHAGLGAALASQITSKIVMY